MTESRKCNQSGCSRPATLRITYRDPSPGPLIFGERMTIDPFPVDWCEVHAPAGATPIPLDGDTATAALAGK